MAKKEIDLLVEHLDVLSSLTDLTGEQKILVATIKYADALAHEDRIEHVAARLAMVLDYYASKHDRETARYAADNVRAYLERWFESDDRRTAGREDA